MRITRFFEDAEGDVRVCFAVKWWGDSSWWSWWGEKLSGVWSGGLHLFQASICVAALWIKSVISVSLFLIICSQISCGFLTFSGVFYKRFLSLCCALLNPSAGSYILYISFTFFTFFPQKTFRLCVAACSRIRCVWRGSRAEVSQQQFGGCWYLLTPLWCWKRLRFVLRKLLIFSVSPDQWCDACLGAGATRLTLMCDSCWRDRVCRTTARAAVAMVTVSQ